MPAKQRLAGYRVAIQMPEDVEKLVERQRAAYWKIHGFKPSRSEMIAIMLRSADRRRDWLELPGKDGGQ